MQSIRNRFATTLKGVFVQWLVLKCTGIPEPQIKFQLCTLENVRKPYHHGQSIHNARGSS